VTGDAVMFISQQEAAAIYARMCLARYRRRARQVVAGEIKRLRRKGDIGGVRAWASVAEELAKVEGGRAERMAG
jgi:hypothetical protein